MSRCGRTGRDSRGPPSVLSPRAGDLRLQFACKPETTAVYDTALAVLEYDPRVRELHRNDAPAVGTSNGVAVRALEPRVGPVVPDVYVSQEAQMVAANGMEVVANGKPRLVEAGWTVEDLIKSLDLDPRFVIVEHNGEALERKRYSDARLSDGDRLELIRAVAGG